jgi:hypothetical protein
MRMKTSIFPCSISKSRFKERKKSNQCLLSLKLVMAIKKRSA